MPDWQRTMIKGVGVDIVKVERVKEALGKKVLCGSEEYKSSEHFAGIWAAKEAIVKAMGCGIGELGFKDMEIIHDELGAPKVVLSSKAQEKIGQMGGAKVHLSISHEKEFAVAFAVIE